MTTIRVFTVIAALVTSSAVFADTPAKAPADKKADKDKPAAADKTPAPTPDKPAKKETISEAAAQKFYAFFEKFVGVVVANQDDCPKMASGLNSLIDANQALIKEANDAKNQNKELPPAIKEKLEKKVRDEFVPALTKKCDKDKTVQTTMERMGKK